MYKVDNAIIMAAGMSRRFIPLSYEKPKALITVKGEVLIERQIKQLQRAGIKDIYIVIGYKAEMFQYLQKKYNVTLIENKEYQTRNNHSSIWSARDVIHNSYICSADNYFTENLFTSRVKESYYSAVYSRGKTNEWCLSFDNSAYINNVTIGGKNSWYMLGHAFWDENFSHKFINILTQEYNQKETYTKLWEHIYIDHIAELKMKIRKYSKTKIFEFDSLDELRTFDTSYINDTRSKIIKDISQYLNAKESDICNIIPTSHQDNIQEFNFICKNIPYKYKDEAIILEE